MEMKLWFNPREIRKVEYLKLVNNGGYPASYSRGFLFIGQENGDHVHVVKIGITSFDVIGNHSEWNPKVRWNDNPGVFLKKELVFLKDIDICGNFFDNPLTNLPHSRTPRDGNKSITLKNNNGPGPADARRAVSHRPNNNNNMSQLSKGGEVKEYIKLQKGDKRLIRTGGRGGRYYMKGGNKIYVNK
jgi:hypothetical protein